MVVMVEIDKGGADEEETKRFVGSGKWKVLRSLVLLALIQ